MKRALTVGAAAVILSVLLPIAPAQAAAGSITVGDGVLYSTCYDLPVTVTLSRRAGYNAQAFANMEIFGPDGLQVPGGYVSVDFTSGQNTGQGSTTMCGTEPVGTYTIRGHAEVCSGGEPGDCYFDDLTPGSFTMRKAKSQTELKVSTKNPVRHSTVRVLITSEDERPNGYFRSNFCKVALEMKQRGKWVQIDGTKGSANKGRRTVVLQVDGPRLKIRAVRAPDHNVEGSYSDPVTIAAQ